MATESSHPPGQGRAPNKGHEKSDANGKWIFGLVLLLLVFGLSLHGILAGFLGALKRGRWPTDLWRPGKGAARALSARPSYPRLQVSAPLDLQSFRMREEAELEEYGWINRTAGVVRIPIERAMDLVLKAGLPTRRNTNANRAGPSSYDLLQQRPGHREPEIQGDK